MTTKRVTTCDRCNRELSDGDYRANFSWEEVAYETATSSGRVSKVIIFEDLCASCAHSVRQQLKQIRPSPSTTAQEEQP